MCIRREDLLDRALGPKDPGALLKFWPRLMLAWIGWKKYTERHETVIKGRRGRRCTAWMKYVLCRCFVFTILVPMNDKVILQTFAYSLGGWAFPVPCHLICSAPDISGTLTIITNLNSHLAGPIVRRESRLLESLFLFRQKIRNMPIALTWKGEPHCCHISLFVNNREICRMTWALCTFFRAGFSRAILSRNSSQESMVSCS